MLTPEMRAPVVVGVKVILIVQEAPGARVAAQLFVCAKSPELASGNRNGADRQSYASDIGQRHRLRRARRSSRHTTEVDRRAAEADQRQRTATANWSSHICLDLRLIQSRVVYPDLVNRSREELAEDAVPANLERVGGSSDASPAGPGSTPARRSRRAATSNRHRSRPGATSCSPSRGVVPRVTASTEPTVTPPPGAPVFVVLSRK